MPEREYKRRPVKGAHVNTYLPPPPAHAEIAVAMLAFDGGEVHYGRRWYGEVSANALAGKLGVVGAQRLGRGAVKGSWSGTMSGALRVAPVLRSMKLAGLVDSYYDRDEHRTLYYLTESGRKLAEGSK